MTLSRVDDELDHCPQVVEFSILVLRSWSKLCPPNRLPWFASKNNLALSGVFQRRIGGTLYHVNAYVQPDVHP